MDKELPKISDLSHHLFWDCDRSKITWEGNSQFLVGRILEYGLIEDWKVLKRVYGIQKTASIAKEIRSLDAVTLSFISLISGIPENQFRCYTERQLNPTLWNS